MSYFLLVFAFALTLMGIGFLIGGHMGKGDWREEERLKALKDVADPIIQELEQISPELDKRIRILRSLIAEADEVISKLEELREGGRDGRSPDISRMIELGFDHVEISKGMGTSIGEIELIKGISALKEGRGNG